MSTKIGFDLDKVFINYPPILPSKVVDWLYRDHNKRELSYRIPHSKIEQFIRKLSHIFLLRPQIKINTDFLTKLSKSDRHYQIFLISSRYKFLEDQTYKILKRYQIFNHFQKIYLNINNSQPHIFKEKIIKQLSLDIYIDDDLDLLIYLSSKLSKTKLFWYNPYQSRDISQDNNIIQINKLPEILNYLPK